MPARPRLILVFTCLSFVACNGGGKETGYTAPDGPVREETRYEGTSRGRLPDGSYEAPEENLLFLRTLDPAPSTVREQAWSWEAGGEVTTFDLTHTVDAEAGTFTADFVTGDGTLRVEGAFDAGGAWAWTAWHSTSTYVDGPDAGVTVQSTDTLDPGSGAIHAEKTVFDVGGEATWIIVEDLTPVSEERFDEVLAGMGG